MRIRLYKLQYVLLTLLIFTLSACGTTGTTNTQTSSKITANIVMPKSSAKTTALAADVFKTRLMVTGPTIPTAKKDYANNTGGSIECYPGSDIAITALAYDNNGKLIYEGATLHQTIVEGDNGVITIQLNAPVVKAENEPCLSCHKSSKDVTGQNLVVDYKQSGHYSNMSWTTNAKNGSTLPGCAGCHGTQHNDVDPSTSGRCFECHGTLGERHQGSGTNAKYLSADKNNCSSCHEPHNPIKGTGYQERKDWAESVTGHGSVSSITFTEYDFKNKNNYGDISCQRCHTTTGFVNFLTSGYTRPTTLWGNPADTTTKEVIACNACHSSDDFKNSVRNAGQYTAQYGGASVQATVKYPDTAKSNVCLPCHVGQLNEASVEAVADFTNNDFGSANSHYLAAGAILNSKVGFKFYTSSAKYIPEFSSTHFAHDQIGINDYKLPITGPFQTTGFNGPCVSCHMPSGNHTMDVAQGYKQAGGICTKCHFGGYAMTDAKIEEEKEGYQAALELFKAVLGLKGMYFIAAYPYFYPSATPAGYGPPNALKNWTAVGPVGGTGKQNMGSAFNFNLLEHEPGAYTHNRVYAKRLIYDSLDYLQNVNVSGAVNFTNFSSASVPVSKAAKYLSKEGAALGTRP